MLVSSIIDQIVKGDLRRTTLSDIGEKDLRSEMQQKNLDTLVEFVNQGLVELYKRFPIKVNIDSSTVFEPTKADDAIALPENAMALLKVVQTSTGEELPLDDYNIEYLFQQGTYKGVYVKTLAINTYLVLGEVDPNGVEVEFHYTSAPDPVRYSSNAPLPAIYAEAMLLYVAYRGYSTIKSTDQTGDDGLSYKKKFEDSCNRILENTTTMQDWMNPKRIWQRGFV